MDTREKGSSWQLLQFPLLPATFRRSPSPWCFPLYLELPPPTRTCDATSLSFRFYLKTRFFQDGVWHSGTNLIEAPNYLIPSPSFFALVSTRLPSCPKFPLLNLRWFALLYSTSSDYTDGAVQTLNNNFFPSQCEAHFMLSAYSPR